MDWTGTATIIQVGANLAVVASVLFLVFQSRLAIRMLREAAERNHMDKHQSVSRMISENPQLAELWSRGSRAGIAALTEPERVQFVNFFTYVLRIWEELFLQKERGLVDQQIWSANVRILRDTKAARGARDAWSVRRHLFTDAFQRFYDEQDESLARPLYDLMPEKTRS